MTAYSALPLKLVSVKPVISGTLIISIPAHTPIPLIKSTAEITEPFTLYSSIKAGRAGFTPCPQSHILVALPVSILPLNTLSFALFIISINFSAPFPVGA